MNPLTLFSKRRSFIFTIFVLVGLWGITLQPITASELPLTPETDTPDITTLELEPLGEFDTVSPDNIGWCPSNTHICRVNRQWTVEEVKAGLDGKKWAVWQEDRQLIFAFWGHVPEVFVVGGLYVELAPVNNSDYWVATLYLGSISRAVISYAFGIVHQNQRQIITESSNVFRGDRAPDAPDTIENLKGYMDTELFYSAELDEIRLISYYLPPNFSYRKTYPVLYMADGQVMEWFAQTVEPLIVQQVIPPMIIVGVHAAYGEPTHNRRAEEYLLGLNDEAYNAHEQYFAESVRRWSELRLKASKDPSERIIMGFSNGAVFAGNTAVRRPDIYGNVIMFSQSQQPLINLRSQVKARFYISAGILEPPIWSMAERFHFTLRLINVDAVIRQRVSGHDALVWQEELPKALQWIFPSDK